NLALRNAWFSGGVEWNACIKGHSPYTCAPLFAQKLEYEDGSVALRMYEYERIRDVAVSIEAWLPEHSQMLYIRPRIENTSVNETPMYWWSNIAVPENEGTRVIVPAEESFVCYYNEGHYLLDSKSIPNTFDTDVSYPQNMKRSLDFFYKIPKESDKWIAAVERDGIGLVQCSTNELIGRKLFVWGHGNGGRNWNEFLSVEGEAYIEIQAGLAKTQLEHIPMPANTTWEWTEAYGAVVCDPKETHSSDWNFAQKAVEKSLKTQLPDIDKMLREITLKRNNIVSSQIIQNGSGWGFLANNERQKLGQPEISNFLQFPESSINKEQEVWLSLIRQNILPCPPSTDIPPVSYIVSAFWRDLLRKSISEGKSNHWYGWLQLGVMEYANGDIEAALKCWETSLEHKSNAWAYRNIAMVFKNEYKQVDIAKDNILNAVELNNKCRALMVDCCAVLIAAGAYKKLLEVFSAMPEILQKDGRLRLFKAIALMRLNQYDKASEIINPAFEMCDIKEGEVSISRVWYELYAEILKNKTGETDKCKLNNMVDELYPLGKLDFRMHT
ncbi:MAG TPA: DUF5107 domain-containing protein, partial [Clostridiaceae bacterium]|nr:DUF5107 domain-containing protein [Clostridiaceae bacterium]